MFGLLSLWTTTCPRSFAIARTVFVVWLFAGGSFSIAFADGGYPCAGAVPIGLNTVQDVYRAPRSGDGLFELDVSSPGILLAEVSDLAAGQMGPRIDLLSDGCETFPGEGLSSPARLVMAVPAPGRFILRVRTSSDLTGGWYRFLTGFAEARPPLSDKVDEWDEDDDGDPFSGPQPSPDKVDEWDEDDDGDPFSGPQPFPDRVVPPAAFSPLAPAAVCALVESDDYGDSAVCAAEVALGSSLPAEVGRASATDVDYFTFTLKAHATVVVESRGETDTYGQLLDADGRRLAADDDGGSGANFRITEELCPGRYVVRVEGAAGSEGPYVLAAALT
jgi:hypothetical protein